MTELDPTTNLPKGADPTKNKDLPQRNALERLQSFNDRHRAAPIEGEQVQGTFGRYDPSMRVTSDRDFNEIRAQSQGVFELIGKSIVQSAGIAGGGAIEGIGFLADMPAYISNMLNGSQQEFERNWLSQVGKDIQEGINDRFQIYQTAQAESGTMSRFLDATYWTSHAPSIASTVSLMIPSFAAAGAIRGLGSLFNVGRRANQVATTLGTALVSRHNYNMLESFDVHERTYEHLLAEGYSEDDAKMEAGRAASDMYAVGYANLWKDTLAWGALLRNVNFANRAVAGSISAGGATTQPLLQQMRNVLIKNPALSAKQAVQKAGFTWKDYLLQAGLEGFEEFNIQFQKNWAMKNSDIALGLTSGDTKGFLESYFSGDMMDHIKDPETWDATLFGFLGGATFQALGAVGTRVMDRGRVAKHAEDLRKVEAQTQRLQQRLKDIDRFTQEGNTIAAEETFQHMINDLVITGFIDANGRIVGSAQEGTLANTREMFEAINQMTAEEIAQLNEQEGVSLGDPAEVKRNAERALSELNRIEEIYNKNSQRTHGTSIDDVLNLYLAEQEYINKVTQETIGKYGQKIADIYGDSATSKLINELNSAEQTYLHNIRRIDRLRNIQKILEEGKIHDAIKDPNRLKINDKVRTKTLVRLQEQIDEVQEQINEAKGEEGLLKKDQKKVQDLNKDLNQNQELTEAEFSKEFRETNLFEGETMLGELLKSENQTLLANSIQSNQEQIRREVAEFIIDQSFTDGDYARIGDEYYRFEKTTDGAYTIQKVDEEFNLMEGEPAQVISDLGEFLETATPFSPEFIITAEQYSEFQEGIDTDLKNEDFEGAISKLNDFLYKTNFQHKVGETRSKIFSALENKINNTNSIKALKEFDNDIDSTLSNARIRDALGEIIREKIANIRKSNEKQLEAFQELFMEKNEEASQIRDHLQETEAEITSIQAEVRKYEEKLRDTANKKNRTQKDILSTHWALRRDLNNAKEKIADRLSDLKATRRKLKAQIRELNKDLDAFQKFKNKLKESGEEMPGIIAREQLQQYVGEFEAIRVETLVDFNLTDYGINKLKTKYEEGLLHTSEVIAVLENYKNAVLNLSMANDTAIQAANRAFDKIKETVEIQSEESVLPETVIDQFNQLYNRYLTQEISKQVQAISGKDAQQYFREVVNASRLNDNIDISEFVNRELEGYRQQVNEYVERLKELKTVVPIYEQILDSIVSKIKNETYKKDPVVKKSSKKDQPEVDFNNPQRLPENVFNRLAGNQGNYNDGLTDDASQRRYGRFVNYQNINEKAGEMQVEFDLPVNVGVTLPENLSDYYDKDEIVLGLIQNLDGEYYKEDGTTTKTFDPEVNVYTTLPLADYHSDKMSKTYVLNDDGSLNVSKDEVARLFPNETYEIGVKKYEKFLERQKQEHQQFRDYIFEQLELGITPTRKILGKSNGKPNEVPANQRDGEPRKLSTYFGEDAFLSESPSVKLKVMTKPTDTFGGQRYTAQEGSVLIYDESTGNYTQGYRRGLRSNEIDTIIEALIYSIENATTNQQGINTEVAIGDLTKTVDGKESPVYFKDILKRYAYALTPDADIRFVEKSNVPGGQLIIERLDRNEDGEIAGLLSETYDLLGEKDGKKRKVVNPKLISALREKLNEMPIQVDSAPLSKPDQSFSNYIYEDGAFKQKNYQNYTEYVLSENTVGTWLKDVDNVEVVQDGVVQTEKGLTHYNQNIYYDKRIDTSQPEQTEVPTTDNISSLAENLKHLDGELLVRKPNSDIAYKIAFDNEYKISAQVPKGTNQETVNKAVEAVKKLRKFLNNDRFDILNQLEIHPDSPLQLAVQEEVEVVESKKETPEDIEQRKKKVREKVEKYRKSQEKPSEPTDGKDLDLDFQRISTSNTLTSSEVNTLTQALSKRTGIPIHIFSEERALMHLEHLRKQGVIDESFTLENLPKGMYHNGNAYVFSKEGITSDTPFHEISHPIVNQIISDNPQLFESLRTEINNSPEGRKLKQRVLSSYPNSNIEGEVTTRAWAEIITTAIGENAADKYYGRANKGFISSLGKMWERIKQFFREIFGEGVVQIENLSDSTTIGDIASLLAETEQTFNLTPSLVTQYQRQETLLPNKDSKFTKQALDAFNHYFFKDLFENKAEKLPQLFTKSGTSSAFYNELVTDVRDYFDRSLDTISERIIKLYNAGDVETAQKGEQLLDNYGYVFENFQDVVNLHKRYLQQYNIEAINDETFILENEKDANELWVTDGLKFSSKQNATSNIRLLIGSLKRKQHATNEAFAIPDNVDFGSAFNLLANSLSNTRDLETMRERVRQMKDKEGMQSLLDRLLDKIDNIDDLSYSDIQTLFEFRKTFGKHYNDYSIIFTGEHGYFKDIDANVDTAKSRLIANWRSNLDPSNPNFTEEKGRLVYDLDSMRKRGVLSAETLVDNPYFDISESLPAIEKQYDRSRKFLAELGIILQTNEPAGETFNNAVQQIYLALRNGENENILSNFSNQKENLYKVIADHEVRNSKDIVENSHVRKSGEKIYNVNLYSYLTLSTDKINEAQNLKQLSQSMPHLFSPYNKHSILLNRRNKNGKLYNFLFNKEGERITKNNLRVEFKDELARDNSNDSDTFDKLSKTDQTLVTINSALEGSYALFRAGDNSIERHIRMFEFFQATDIRDGKHLELFQQYLQDELNTIIDIQNSDVKYSALEGKSATQLMKEFPILNIFAGNKIIADAFEQAIDSGDTSVFFNGKVLQTINNKLNEYFKAEVKRTKDYLIENRLITPDTAKEYINHGLTGLTTDNASRIKEANLTNILNKAIVNRFVANIEQTKLISGPPIFYNNADNLFKRMSGVVGTKESSGVSHIENKIIEQYFPRKNSKRLYKEVIGEGLLSEEFTDYKDGAKPILRSSVFADVKIQSSYINKLKQLGVNEDAYISIDEADAVGFVSLDGWRDMHLRSSQWTQELERLYQWESRPEGATSVEFTNWTTGEVETVTESDLLNTDGSRTVATMIKPQYFGPLAENGFIPGMYKTAFLPILPHYANQYPSMRSLIEYQNNFNIDLVTFPSANKVGIKLSEEGTVPEAYKNEDGNAIPNFEEGQIQDTFYEYWGIQLDTGSKVKDRVVKGTQLMKMIFSNIYENGEAVNPELDSLATELTNINDALIQKGLQELITELDLTLENGNYTVESVENLISFLEAEAIKRDVNNNVIDSLNILKEYWNNSNLGFDIMSNRDKIENILASIADNRVISQKMPGGSKVQTPVTFFEKGTRRYSNQEAHLRSQELKFYEDGTMEVYLPHYFKEVMRDMDLSEVQDEMLLKGIGFRIPTSGLNSVEHIKIAGFLPQSAGETIVVPSEIVAKAGSDFDVDKLNVFLPNYKMKDGEPTYVKFLDRQDFNKKENFIDAVYEQNFGELLDKKAQLTERYNEKIETNDQINTLFDALTGDTLEELGFLADDNLRTKLLNTPTKKEFAKQIESQGPTQYNSREALENKMIETMGKIISHPENQSQLLESIGTSLIKAEETYIVEKLNLPTDQKSMTDVMGNFEYSMEVMKRNLESKQLTGIAALHSSDHIHSMRYGYEMGKTHKIHLPHNEIDGRISLGGQTTTDGVSITSILNQLVNTAVDGAKEPIFYNLNMNLDTANVVFYLLRAGVPLRDTFEFINEPIIRDYIQLERSRKGITDVGLNASNVKSIVTNKHKGKASVLKQYIQYEQSAEVLNNYIQGTRMDTQGMGKNTSQLDFVLENAKKIANKQSGIRNADKLLNDGYLKHHYEALQTFDRMFESFFVTKSNNDASVAYQTLIEHYAPKKMDLESKIKILDKFKADYLTHIVLLNQTKIGDSITQPIGSQTDLFIGDNTVAKQLKEYKEFTDNLLVHALQPVIGTEKFRIRGKEQFIDTVKLYDQRMDTVEFNSYIDAFRELFAENKPLAINLTKLAFAQGGLQLTPMSYTNIIPAEIYTQMIDTAFKNHSGTSPTSFLRKFYLSNYHDTSIVPTKYGKRTPDNWIYKTYPPLKLTKQERQERERLNKPTTRSTPTILVNIAKDAENLALFQNLGVEKGIVSIQSDAIRENRHNINLLFYGDFIETKKWTSEGEQITQIPDKTKTRTQALKDANNCRI